MEELVSIIIPAKNPNEEIFSECLESIFQQTYQNIEVIVVDASDKKPAILDNYEGNITYVKQKRRNVGGGRQDALEIANGKYVLNIDSDCIADKNWVCEIVKCFSEINNEVIIVGRSLSINDNIIATEIQKEYDNWLYYIICKMNNKKYCLTVDGKNFGYIRSFGVRIGFDENLKASEDMDFATRARRKGYRIIYNENAIVHHVHRQNIKELIRQKIWHGTGYGQNMVKNNIDFEMHFQIKRLLMLLGAILIFPITLSLVSHLYKVNQASLTSSKKPFLLIL